MGKKTLIIASVIAAVVVFIIINATNPTAAGPLGVLALFIFSYIITLTAVTYIVYGVSAAVVKLSSLQSNTKPIRASLSFRKSYYYASIIALGLIMLLGMQSVTGIELYEFFLVCFFVIVGCLYVSRRMV